MADRGLRFGIRYVGVIMSSGMLPLFVALVRAFGEEILVGLDWVLDAAWRLARVQIPGPRTWCRWRTDKREHAGLCRACGCSLRGNVSGVCPECGMPTMDVTP